MRAVLFTLLLSLALLSSEYVVVISKDAAGVALSKRYIKEMYLKKRGFLGKHKVMPINLPPVDQIRMRFEKRVLGMDTDDINEYWIEQHYKGKKPPFVQNSQGSIKAFIKNMTGAIGYMEKSQVDDGLKILYEF